MPPPAQQTWSFCGRSGHRRQIRLNVEPWPSFTENRWVRTYDPPLMGVTADRSSTAVFVGSYELLTDTRMLFVFERPVEGELVFEYSLDASTLVFTLAGERWLTATRVRR